VSRLLLQEQTASRCSTLRQLGIRAQRAGSSGEPLLKYLSRTQKQLRIIFIENLALTFGRELMRSAVVFDLDGTISNDAHRKHFVTSDKKDYDQYYGRMGFDEPVEPVIELMKLYKERGYSVLVLTGRPEKYSGITHWWLFKHKVPHDLVLMRDDKDRRKNAEFKKDIYLNKLKPNFNVHLAVDDHEEVVKMWRELGVSVIKVG
jgi:hypothetical protein